MQIHCQPIRDNTPPFKAYKTFENKFIRTSSLKELKNKYAIRDVYEGQQATFTKLTIFDSATNKKLVERVREVFKKDKSNPSFKGTTNIKKLWRSGQLPSVKVGLYLDTLTQSNLSYEHLKSKSAGGKTVESNLALASKQANNNRGNSPLSWFLTEEMLEKYLEQFKGVVVKGFCGDCYARKIRRTVHNIFRKEQENAIENCK